MQYGYVFTDPKRSKIVVLTKQGDVEYLSTNTKENFSYLPLDKKLIGSKLATTIIFHYGRINKNNSTGS